MQSCVPWHRLQHLNKVIVSNKDSKCAYISQNWHGLNRGKSSDKNSSSMYLIYLLQKGSEVYLQQYTLEDVEESQKYLILWALYLEGIHLVMYKMTLCSICLTFTHLHHIQWCNDCVGYEEGVGFYNHMQWFLKSTFLSQFDKPKIHILAFLVAEICHLFQNIILYNF